MSHLHGSSLMQFGVHTTVEVEGMGETGDCEAMTR